MTAKKWADDVSNVSTKQDDESRYKRADACNGNGDKKDYQLWGSKVVTFRVISYTLFQLSFTV